MRRCLTALFLLCALCGVACDDAVLPIADPAPCVCGDDGEGCADDWCSYELSLEMSCLGQVTQAEILVDGHLESDLLGFETVEGGQLPTLVVPCTRTEPGAETRIDVFAGKWAWSRTGNTCDIPGQVKQILFGCVTE